VKKPKKNVTRSKDMKMLGMATIIHRGPKANTCTGVGNMQRAPYTTRKYKRQTIHV
jgi:hypothetical protein